MIASNQQAPYECVLFALCICPGIIKLQMSANQIPSNVLKSKTVQWLTVSFSVLTHISTRRRCRKLINVSSR